MNYRTLTVFIFTLLTAQLAEAQYFYDTGRKRLNKQTYRGKRLVRTGLGATGVLNRFGTGLPINIEVNFDDQWSALLSYQVPFYGRFEFPLTDYPEKKITQDFRMRAQVRSHFASEEYSRWFVGFEAFHSRQAYEEYSGEYRSDKSMISFAIADVTKSVTGLGAILGYEFVLFKGLAMEFDLGFGLKLVDIDRDNVHGLSQPYSRRHTKHNKEDQVGDVALLPYVPFNIAITYGFGKL